MKSWRFLLFIVVAGIVCAMPAGVFPQEGYYYPDLDYRQRGSYLVNGKRHTVIMDTYWGSIVYIPEQMTDMAIKYNFDSVTVDSSAGKVKIMGEYDKDLSISTPDGDLKVNVASDGGTLTYQKESYSVKTSGNNEMVITLPDDTITYRTGVDFVEISGKKGKVHYAKTSDGYTVKSPAGTTRYTFQLDGTSRFEGVALENHLYGFWGIEFFLTKYKIGVIVELNRLISFPTIPRQIQFDEAIEVKL